MNGMQNYNKEERQLQIIMCLQIIQLLKKLSGEINQSEVQSQQSYFLQSNIHINQIKDDFIHQCFDSTSNDINSINSSYFHNFNEDYYLTKRGNSCLIQNGYKQFKCKNCLEAFDTPQKLGNHTSKIHYKTQNIKKSIQKN